MKANPRFQNLSKRFWANVRTLTEEVGYTAGGSVKGLTFREMLKGLADLGLRADHVQTARGGPNGFARLLIAYCKYRADVLNGTVVKHLQDSVDAKKMYELLVTKHGELAKVPMNKQRGVMRDVAFLTASANILISSHTTGQPCDFDPQVLTTVTHDGQPVRTLARRVDGAFPGPVNPIAVWELKEYYYTTTFGSRIADGVYESLLDGMELEELRQNEGKQVRHYFIVDGKGTWWSSGGRPYLCRIVDMLHMGFVDEVLFGSEIVTRLPELAREWMEVAATERDLTPTDIAKQQRGDMPAEKAEP